MENMTFHGFITFAIGLVGNSRSTFVSHISKVCHALAIQTFKQQEYR